MKGKGWAIIFLGAALQFCLLAEDANFAKGVCYFLLKNDELCRKHLNLYFDRNPNQNVSKGYALLLKKQVKDATRSFQNFLEIDYSNPEALIGIALSTEHMQDTNAAEVLKRIVRLYPNYSSAYLLIGYFYLKDKDYPKAETNLKTAIQTLNIPEYKVFLADLLAEKNLPQDIFTLLGKDAEDNPGNFYLNLYAGRALLALNETGKAGIFIENARTAQPQNALGKLLQAKYLLAMDKPQEARQLLAQVRDENENYEYLKTMAVILVKLKDPHARDYLYRLFEKNQWDMDANRLLALFYMSVTDRANAENSLYRALLSGCNPRELIALFPGNYTFPALRSAPFFFVRKMQWLSKKLLLIAGKLNSGDEEKIYLLNWESMKIQTVFPVAGITLEMFPSPDGLSVLLLSQNPETKTLSLSLLISLEKKIQCVPIGSSALPFLKAKIEFSPEGQSLYIFDQQIAAHAFESPFSLPQTVDSKLPLYPRLKLPVYRYHFPTGNWTLVPENGVFELPIPTMQKYRLVLKAMQVNSRIRDMVEKGMSLDITSSVSIRIFFPADLSGMVIYQSDLDKAFNAFVYQTDPEQVIAVNETLFLGKEYSKIKFIDFLPRQRELILLMDNKDKRLIKFAYESLFYSEMIQPLFSYYFDSFSGYAFILKADPQSSYARASDILMISYDPYTRERIFPGKSIVKIIPAPENGGFYFISSSRQALKLNDQLELTYVGPSLEDTITAYYPNRNYMAVAINNRIHIIENWGHPVH